MAKKSPTPKSVVTLNHEDATRKNIPSAEQQSILQKEVEQPRAVKYPRNTDLDPQPDGSPDWLHLIVEIKGYRREDAKEKKSTMDTYWVPGVNHLGTYGRWAFAEFTEIYQIESDFAAKVQGAFAAMIAATVAH